MALIKPCAHQPTELPLCPGGHTKLSSQLFSVTCLLCEGWKSSGKAAFLGPPILPVRTSHLTQTSFSWACLSPCQPPPLENEFLVAGISLVLGPQWPVHFADYPFRIFRRINHVKMVLTTHLEFGFKWQVPLAVLKDPCELSHSWTFTLCPLLVCE